MTLISSSNGIIKIRSSEGNRNINISKNNENIIVTVNNNNYSIRVYEIKELRLYPDSGVDIVKSDHK